MGWSKPFSEVEITFIENKWNELGTAETARRLKRSKRGVENVVNRLGLRASCAPAPTRVDTAVETVEEDDLSEVDELKLLKRELKSTLRNCWDPKAVPSLSKEIRETLSRISELEGENDRGGLDGELLGLVQLRPS